MQNITLRLPEEMVEELDREATEHGDSRSEHIREILRARDEDDVSREEYDALQHEHTALRAELRNAYERQRWQRQTIDRLQNEKEALIENRADTNALVEYVEASWWQRLKWRFGGGE